MTDYNDETNNPPPKKVAVGVWDDRPRLFGMFASYPVGPDSKLKQKIGRVDFFNTCLSCASKGRSHPKLVSVGGYVMINRKIYAASWQFGVVLAGAALLGWMLY